MPASLELDFGASTYKTQTSLFGNGLLSATFGLAVAGISLSRGASFEDAKQAALRSAALFMGITTAAEMVLNSQLANK